MLNLQKTRTIHSCIVRVNETPALTLQITKIKFMGCPFFDPDEVNIRKMSAKFSKKITKLLFLTTQTILLNLSEREDQRQTIYSTEVNQNSHFI